MKKKIISYFLAVSVVAGMIVLPHSASAADILADTAAPSSNPSNLAVSGGKVTFTKSGQYVEYEINAPEAGSYYVNFNREKIATGNFYIEATVNGETVNRRTGRTANADGSFTFQDEVQLNEGLNTVRIANMSSNDGNFWGLSFSKLENKQYTTSMNTYATGRTFKSAYKSGVAIDPWVNITDSLTVYSDGENAPYITFDVEIPTEGEYYPAVAMSGDDKVEMIVDGISFRVCDDGMTLSEIYKASGSSSCTWRKSNSHISLDAGAHEVTLKLYEPAGENNWETYFGAVRFIEYIPVEVPEYDGDFTLDILSPVRSEGTEVVSGTLAVDSGDWAEYDIIVPEDASYYMSFALTEESSKFHMYAQVNGETINKRTGGIKNGESGYTYLDEIQLKEGLNTIKIGAMNANSGNISGISFKKLDRFQYTTSMNSYSTGRTFEQAYKDEIYVDPWLWINDLVSDYPDGENAPYITFKVDIPRDGEYSPAVAMSGANKVELTIDGKSFRINENGSTLSEAYYASLNSNAKCAWGKSNDYISLEAGEYDVTLKLYSPVSGAEKWNTFFGAIRLIEYVPIKADVYYGDITLDLLNPSGKSGVEITETDIVMDGGDWAEYDVMVPEAGSYYVNFERASLEGNFYIEVSANNKIVNRRSGRGANSDGSYKFLDELQLKAGNNTIRVAAMGSNVKGVVSTVTLKKLDKRQYTVSMNPATGTRTFKDAYSAKLGVDPWLYINESHKTYAPANSPFVTLDIEVTEAGYYYPEIARAGVTFAKVYVDGQSFDMHGNAEALSEKYIASSGTNTTCTWVRSKTPVYLSEGVHEMTVKTVGALYSPEMNWRLSLGAIRLSQCPDQHTKITVEGEDARVFTGESETEVAFDQDSITLAQTDDSEVASKISAATVAVVKTPVTDAAVKMEMDIVVKKAGEYTVDILKAHDVEALSEGTLSITSQEGEEILSSVVLDNENVTEVQTDYAQLPQLDKNGLDVIRLNENVYLPEGVHKMTVAAGADDVDASGEMIRLFLDAVTFTEAVNISGITVNPQKDSIGKGQKVKLVFENENGESVYLNRLNNVFFSTTDESVAVIDEEGIIKGIEIGNFTAIVEVDGEVFEFPMSVTGDNGLVVKSAILNGGGDIEITYLANEKEKFDIVVANYEEIDGKKTSVRGLFEPVTVTANGEEETIIITKPADTSDFGGLYEIYMWKKEADLTAVYNKIQIK